MKSDLDKLLNDEQIYRHEDLKSVSDKWNSLATFLQFGTLGLLFVSLFIFNSLSKTTVKGLIWYWAAGMFVLATITFFISRIALKNQMSYMNAENVRVMKLTDDAIKKLVGK